MKRKLGLIAATLAVVFLLAQVGGSGRARAQSSSLRDVDWFAAILADPHVQAVNDVPSANNPFDAPYVQIDFRGTHVEGYPIAGDPRFGDIDGDGIEEAVIGVASGGTAGETGFMVFHQAPGAPELAYLGAGYKLNATISNGQLAVISASFVGFEPNCCPSAIITSTYVLAGNDLILVNESDEPTPIQELTVQAYYQALDRHEFADAYQFLNADYQFSHPFERWVQGFATTVHAQVQTAPTDDPNVVHIDLTAVDSKPDGGTVTSHFTGTWTLSFHHDAHRWVLESASIVAVP
jgi:hypothetical protein